MGLIDLDLTAYVWIKKNLDFGFIILDNFVNSGFKPISDLPI